MQQTFLRRGAASIAVGAVTAATLLAGAGLASADVTTTEFNNACRATAKLNVSKDTPSGVTVDAPASVRSGDEFTYTMQVAPTSFPNADSGATTTNISRLKWDFEIPENIDFISATHVGNGINLDGKAPSVIRINDAGLADPNGPFLRLSGNNEVIANGANNNTKSEGGIRAPKLKKNLDGSASGGDSHFQAPLVSVTVRAGQSGVIQPKVRTTGAAANWNNDRNWNTSLPSASFLGKQWAPTRCAPMDGPNQALNAGGGPLATININSAQVDVETTTVLTGSAAVETGSAGSFTAKVAPAEATGNVQLTVDGENSGEPVAVTVGQTDYALSHEFGAEGTFDVKAVFTADAGFTSSTSAGMSVTVTNAEVPDQQTTTTVTEPDSAEVGMGVNISAQVSPTPIGGTVQFKDGTSNIGQPVEVDSSGSATLSQHEFTSAGLRSITAIYSGTAGFEGSASMALSVNVTVPVTADVETTTALTVPSSATAGQTVTLKATVTPANAGGTVQFKISGANVGQPVQVVQNGVATLTHAFAAAGEFDVTAEFSGVEGFKDSSSTVSTVNVTGGTGGDTNPLGSLGAIFGSLGG